MRYNTTMKKIKSLLRKTINALLPTESLGKSKEKWNSLAGKNAAYYVMTNYGEGITEQQFRDSGEKDYKEHVETDALLKEELSPFTEKNVLEIGCGIGRITEFFAKNFHSVSGVDISEEMIQQGTKRLASHSNITFKATNGVSFPFSNKAFDFVFSFIVFQHMPDKKTVTKNLLEIARVLKDDGIAKIQLRGLPTSKRRWFYGPAFVNKDVEKMIATMPFTLLKSEGEGQRYFWIWLRKNSTH